MALPHTGDPIKEQEHLAMEALFTNAPPTIQTIPTSGAREDDFFNPAVWDQNRVPRVGDNVRINSGWKLNISAVLPDPLNTLRIGGGAWLNALTDRNTGLSVVTTGVMFDDATATPGKLSLGDVGSPIQPGFAHNWIIADRGPRNAAMQAYDPLDMSGCIMSHGTLRLFGSPDMSYAVPTAALPAGTDMVSFSPVPAPWKVGDVLMFPGLIGECETRTILDITGNVVTFDSKLAYDHGSHPTLRAMGALGLGLLPNVAGLAPVCNLTRNGTIRSANPLTLLSRGHVMQMHRQDFLADNFCFLDLGRTDAMRPHTNPQLTFFDPTTGAMGTLTSGYDAAGNFVQFSDSNTMGRYPVHGHVRDGASWSSTPITITNCAVWGAAAPLPKHGIVGHGAYYDFRNNVVFNGKGSGLFGENAAGMGDMRFNLSAAFVGEAGASGSIDTRPGRGATPGDTGFDGEGIWNSDSLTELTDNQAWGCYIGLASYPRGLLSDQVLNQMGVLQSANINPPASANQQRPQIDVQALVGTAATADPQLVPNYIARCYSAGCEIGFLTYAISPLQSTFNLYCDKVTNGWHASYTKRTTLLNSIIAGADVTKDQYTSLGNGIVGNVETRSLTLQGSTIEGFQNGLNMSLFRGDFKISGCHFNNNNDIGVDAPWDGSLEIDTTTFGDLGPPILYAKNTKISLSNTEQFNGTNVDPSPLFSRFAPFVMTLDGQNVLHNIRLPQSIPFPQSIQGLNPALIGLKNAPIFTQFNEWVGGYQIPDQPLTADPRIVGGGIGSLGALVSPASMPVAMFSASPLMGQAPLAVQFTDQSTNSPTSWAWDFGDGGTSTLQNPSHVYASAGTYSVTLKATNSGGTGTLAKTGLIVVAVQMVTTLDIAAGLNSAEAAAYSAAMSTAKSGGFPLVLPATHVYMQTPAAGSSVPIGSTITVN